MGEKKFESNVLAKKKKHKKAINSHNGFTTLKLLWPTRTFNGFLEWFVTLVGKFPFSYVCITQNQKI